MCGTHSTLYTPVCHFASMATNSVGQGGCGSLLDADELHINHCGHIERIFPLTWWEEAECLMLFDMVQNKVSKGVLRFHDVKFLSPLFILG